MTLSFHHIHLLAGGGENVFQSAQLHAIFIYHVQADDVGQEEGALRQVGVLSTDVHHLVFQQHGGVYVGHTLQLSDDAVFVDPGIQNLHRLAVDIQGGELAEKIGAVRPGDDFHLTANAVGVDDLAALQIGMDHNRFTSLCQNQKGGGLPPP